MKIGTAVIYQGVAWVFNGFRAGDRAVIGKPHRRPITVRITDIRRASGRKVKLSSLRSNADAIRNRADRQWAIRLKELEAQGLGQKTG